jgi:hypothetical protein
VWSLYHIASYLLIEAACRTGWLAGKVASLTTLSVVVLGLTLASIVAIAWGGLASYRRYQRRHAQIQEAVYPDRAETAARFLTLTAVMLSALFALLVLLAGIPALFLSPCLMP